MQKKSFIYHEKLEQMLAAKTAELNGKELFMVENQKTYTLTPAVKFLGCETNGGDPLGLVGKVASFANLQKRGAEIYLSSAIYEGHSFRIDQGYICRLASDEKDSN